ncbi:hypothetical protein BH18ACT8_BH18ACT8_10880 [soil metagenome]
MLMRTTEVVDAGRGRAGLVAAALILMLTVAQLVVLTYVPDLPQAEGKAFGARLLWYPILMLATPAVWWLVRRPRGGPVQLPWPGFALIMSPFLIDVTGNTLDFYRSIEWWDDLNHFTNWFLLCLGIGLLMRHARMSPRWALTVTVTGAGATLAILWELGEWYTFIRHGTELGTAYEDTLGDETLGSLGGLVAGLVVGSLGSHDNR